MSAYETIWTGTYFRVELRTAFAPLGKSLGDWYCIVPTDITAGSRYVTRAAHVDQKYVDSAAAEYRLSDTLTAKDVMIADAQKMDHEEIWLAGHPGVLVNMDTMPRGGDQPPADS